MTLDNVAIVHASCAYAKAASNLSISCAVNTTTPANNSDCAFNTVNAVQSTSCAARKAAASDTVATTNAEFAAEDGNKLVGIPTSNGGNNAHGTPRKDAATLMQGAVAECNKSAAAERTSIRISGAIALLLHIPPETVQIIIGRWTSNTSMDKQYVANKMTNTHYITAPVYHMKKGNQ